MQTVDVAVVGGGPGGLATAISIKRACRHLNVKVFERVPRITPRGAGIKVEVNGEKALEAIDPALHAALCATGRNPSSILQFDDQGEVAAAVPSVELSDQTSRWGYRTFFAGWSDMQQTLADHLSTVAEPGTLQLGARFKTMHVEDDGVVLDFDGSIPPVKAKVVVGADGYRSKVRQLWLDDGPPEFAGYVIWRGRLPEDVCPVPPDAIASTIRDATAMLTYPGNKGHTVWNASAPVERLEAVGLQRVSPGHAESHQASAHSRENDTLPGEEIKRRALLVFAKHPRIMREAIQLTDPAVVMEHDICYRPHTTFPDAGPLGCGPITLLGDAAHVKRPNGLGLNQTFEDALQLGHCLREGGPTEAALRAYESARMPRWKFLAAVSDANVKHNYFGAEALTKEEAALVMGRPEVQEQVLGVQLRPLAVAAEA